MSQSVFRSYLKSLHVLAEKFVPNAAQQDRDLRQRFEDLKATDAHGRKTGKATQSRQLLRNPWLISTDRNKLRRRLLNTAAKTEAIAAKAIAEALKFGILAEQAAIEVREFDEAVPPEGISKSREEHEGTGYHERFCMPLFDTLYERGVASSTVHRAPAYLHDMYALTLRDWQRDPEMKDPSNRLVAMAKAGILDAYKEGMTEIEAQAVDTAQAMSESPDIAELQQALSAARPGEPPISAAFLQGCIRLRDEAGKQSAGTMLALDDAHNHMWQSDAKVVAEILELDDSDAEAVDKVVSFLRYKTDNAALADLGLHATYFQIKLMIEHLDPPTCHTNEWVPQFVEWISAFAAQMQGVIRSEQVFLAIMHAAFDSSIAKARFDQIVIDEKLAEERKVQLRYLDEALESGRPFKFDRDGYALTDEYDGYHYIPGPPLTKESYLGTRPSPAQKRDDELENRADKQSVEHMSNQENESISIGGEGSDDPTAPATFFASELQDKGIMPDLEANDLAVDLFSRPHAEFGNSAEPQIADPENEGGEFQIKSPPATLGGAEFVTAPVKTAGLNQKASSSSLSNNPSYENAVSQESNPEAQGDASARKIPAIVNQLQRMPPKRIDDIDDEEMI